MLAITLATALVAHLAFDVVGDGWAALLRPLHLVYLAFVAAAVAFASREVCASGRSERRRRLALMQARLRGAPRRIALVAASQVVLAGFTLSLEGHSRDPFQLTLAALAAVLALLAGAAVMRRVESAVLRFAAGVFARIAPRERTTFTLASYAWVPVRTDDAYELFRPNRPPPAFA
ncbi:MAG TPA: hypothetical protein VHS78_18485 [Candidatus Elarobacter sp.]|nr:hypothetical protein [Candidatus Elarobacter sp.]